jgi:hypothetical protein
MECNVTATGVGAHWRTPRRQAVVAPEVYHLLCAQREGCRLLGQRSPATASTPPPLKAASVHSLLHGVGCFTGIVSVCCA